MSFTHIYTVPAYYPEFRCKAGDCRHPCCTGWDIAITMKEYFHMLGRNCSPELRRRLDTAFHPADDPSESHYAVISPNWHGDCPLHLPNGYCGLQCECGESAIPSVCRYYPRSPKSKYAYQCQCSNSCEAVVEMLFARAEPMTFQRQRLTFHIEEELPHVNDPIAHLFPTIQRACLHTLQDRSKPLSLRLWHLGELTQIMDVPYRIGNTDGIRAVLPYHTVADYVQETHRALPPDDKELRGALGCLRYLLNWLEENNESLRESAISAKKLLKLSDQGEIPDETIHCWHSMTAAFDALFPQNEQMLEQIFVNHLCYVCYPFSEEHGTMWDAYLAFMAAYALVRLLSVCHLAEHTKEETELSPLAAYADITADVFRFVEHTNFSHNAPVLMRRAAFDHPDHITLFCRL